MSEWTYNGYKRGDWQLQHTGTDSRNYNDIYYNTTKKLEISRRGTTSTDNCATMQKWAGMSDYVWFHRPRRYTLSPQNNFEQPKFLYFSIYSRPSSKWRFGLLRPLKYNVRPFYIQIQGFYMAATSIWVKHHATNASGKIDQTMKLRL